MITTENFVSIQRAFIRVISFIFFMGFPKMAQKGKQE